MIAYFGPFPLTTNAIDGAVTKRSPGTYFIGRFEDGKFIYVKFGRSDGDVNQRLKSYVSDSEFSRWRYFKCRYWPTARAAYEEECRLWHRHEKKPPKNDNHPNLPDGVDDYGCPIKACPHAKS